MAHEVKLSQLDRFLDDLEYPVSRKDAVAGCADVTLVLADGEAELPEVVASSNADRFETMDELLTEVMGLLPRNAVGEPYQSEGEG